MARKGALAAAPARSRPAARLRRPDIAAAGVAIADREGIDAVSMRRVAAALGAGTMSLYRHVADRGDLLDVMVEAVYAAAELPASPGVDWRRDVALVADAQRRLMRAHPWVAPLVGTRPPVRPTFLRAFELSLRAFETAGLGITEAAGAGAMVNAFVAGFALFEHAEQVARQRTGLTKEQWRLRNWPLVERALAGGDYPSVARFVEHGRDLDMDAVFDAALGHLLDGVERSLAAGPATRATTGPAL